MNLLWTSLECWTIRKWKWMNECLSKSLLNEDLLPALGPKVRQAHERDSGTSHSINLPPLTKKKKEKSMED